MATPPETLHHYTTAGGLLGILEPTGLGKGWDEDPSLQGFSEVRSFSLWSTDARYLNDSAELTYGAAQLADALAARIKNAAKGRRESLKTLAENLRKGDFSTEDYQGAAAHTAYVTCFCRDGDLLSQWRGYGANGGGYSVEFRTEAIQGLRVPAFGSEDNVIGYVMGLPLCQVHYGLDSETIGKAADVIVGHEESGWDLLNALVELAQFKDPAFKEEDEWRFVYSSGRAYAPCRFRATASGAIVPYLVLVSLQPEGLYSGIKSITVGPGPDQALRVEAVRQLLARRAFYDVEVRQSSMTYRG